MRTFAGSAAAPHVASSSHLRQVHHGAHQLAAVLDDRDKMRALRHPPRLPGGNSESLPEVIVRTSFRHLHRFSLRFHPLHAPTSRSISITPSSKAPQSPQEYPASVAVSQ